MQRIQIPCTYAKPTRAIFHGGKGISYEIGKLWHIADGAKKMPHRSTRQDVPVDIPLFTQSAVDPVSLPVISRRHSNGHLGRLSRGAECTSSPASRIIISFPQVASACSARISATSRSGFNMVLSESRVGNILLCPYIAQSPRAKLLKASTFSLFQLQTLVMI